MPNLQMVPCRSSRSVDTPAAEPAMLTQWYIFSGVPHRIIKDDVYKGMFIPKGSIIIPNALYVPCSLLNSRTYPSPRSMVWDDKIYVDPTKFHPERFLPKSAGGNEEPYPISTFGFGRR